MANRNNECVGVFDSGVGGISVLARLVEELPHENFVYFGDSAFAPYGEKTRDQVMRRSRSIVDKLYEQGAKAVVIACNTATSVAASTLRADYAHVPIIGMEPALKPAVLAGGAGPVLVMATPITLRLDKFHQLAARWGSRREVIPVPCPGLAGRIEQGRLGDADLAEMIDGLVGRYRGQVDGVVLGCTHYSFVANQIRDVLGNVALFDGAAGTAHQLARKLAERDLASKSTHAGTVSFITSEDSPGELELYETFYTRARSASSY